MLDLKSLKYAYIKGFIISNNLNEYMDIANKQLDLLTDRDLDILDNVVKE